MSQLITYIIILVVIFVIVGIIMAVSVVRLRNQGRNVPTVTAPIPDREQGNKQTRIDNATNASYNGSSNGSSPTTERKRNRS